MEGRVRVYSVAVNKRGRILAESSNLYRKSHPKQAHYAAKVGLPKKVFLHSELATLVKLAKCSDEVDTLYVARVNAQGSPVPASPCPICSLAIEEAGITNIVTT